MKNENKTMTIDEINSFCNSDEVTKYKGIFTVRRCFYYGNNWKNITIEKLKTVPNIEIINSGEQWRPFRGGDTIKKGSHYWITFKFI